MTIRTKQIIIALLSSAFIVSLIFVQWMEVVRKREEAGIGVRHVSVPASSDACVKCHQQLSPGIIDHWKGSTHAVKGVGCVECHQAEKNDADAFDHYGALIAVVVTPRDCGRCHKTETQEFMASHHARAGNILASLDNFLAETVEGSRVPFDPHSPTPGRDVELVNGMASVDTGCKQCHGGKIALEATDGSLITVDQLRPDGDGKPTNKDILAKVKKASNGRPILAASSWPNTGIGRLNLDGSLGSCSACHSRHDFSPRRARQPENCGKCHLGPDHPQKEIYEESKHGVAALRQGDVAWSKAPCRFCGTGCGVEVGVADGKVVAVRGDELSPVNKGLLCVKGYHLPGLLYGRDRLQQPLKRNDAGQGFHSISWDEALDLIARKFQETLDQHGPQAVAMYGLRPVDRVRRLCGPQMVQSRHAEQQPRGERPRVHGQCRDGFSDMLNLFADARMWDSDAGDNRLEQNEENPDGFQV